MIETSLNYWAVVVAAIASFVLGYLWFGPFFGKTWIRLSGISPEKMRAAGAMKGGAMAWNYLLALIGSFLTACVLGSGLIYYSAYLKTAGISAGLLAGFFAWLGFVAPLTLGSVLWEGKSWSLWLFNNAYYLVSFLLMGVILALWV